MFKAEVVGDSVNSVKGHIISLKITFPRILLPEMNTHRTLTKSTSSNRYMSFNDIVEAVAEDPFIPMVFQEDSKNGVPGAYITDTERIIECEEKWLEAMCKAIDHARYLHKNLRVSRQLVNRLLEPYMWCTMLVTGTASSWDNFFKLRCPKYTSDVLEGSCCSWRTFVAALGEKGIDMDIDAYPLAKIVYNSGSAEAHMMHLAELIHDAIEDYTAQILEPYGWHIPFEKQILEAYPSSTVRERLKISIVMAARMSYSIADDLKVPTLEEADRIYNKLLNSKPPHMVPFEHCANALPKEVIDTIPSYRNNYYQNYEGFISYRHYLESEYDNKPV